MFKNEKEKRELEAIHPLKIHQLSKNMYNFSVLPK
jgi:hypothetical protein